MEYRSTANSSQHW
ncbi:unnamed protein product [Linum tenue]|uniref:Uncharacterized protein n=1 Tax=Linum tenue TaxID=586396 RepID=A0AAV0NS34_9ROSI|nr:unnamed protein product [Linum tenue]